MRNSARFPRVRIKTLAQPAFDVKITFKFSFIIFGLEKLNILIELAMSQQKEM